MTWPVWIVLLIWLNTSEGDGGGGHSASRHRDNGGATNEAKTYGQHTGNGEGFTREFFFISPFFLYQ